MGSQRLTANGSVELVAHRTLPAARVLLLPIDYVFVADKTHCFVSSASDLQVWYHAHGAAVTSMTIGPDEQMLLDVLGAAKGPFERVITLSHGGLDGPIFEADIAQIGWDWPDSAQTGHFGTSLGNREAAIRLGALWNKVTSPQGYLYVGQCNPANPNESNIDPGYTYLQLTTCLSNRTTWGTSTQSACWDITRRVEALDGQNLVTAALTKSTPAALPKNPKSPFVCTHGSTAAAISAIGLEQAGAVSAAP